MKKLDIDIYFESGSVKRLLGVEATFDELNRAFNDAVHKRRPFIQFSTGAVDASKIDFIDIVREVDDAE